LWHTPAIGSSGSEPEVLDVRKAAVRLPVEEKQRVVLAVLAGELTAAEAARGHGVSTNAVLSWRSKFLDAGRRALEEKISGPDRDTGTAVRISFRTQ